MVANFIQRHFLHKGDDDDDDDDDDNDKDDDDDDDDNNNNNNVAQDSSIGIATRYGLDDPGIESRWGGEIFRIRPNGPGAHPASFTMGTGSFSGGG